MVERVKIETLVTPFRYLISDDTINSTASVCSVIRRDSLVRDMPLGVVVRPPPSRTSTEGSIARGESHEARADAYIGTFD